MDIRLQNIAEIEKDLQKKIKKFKEFLVDPKVPLEERWLGFCKYCSYLPETTDNPDYGPIELCSMYNPPDRYKTYYYCDDVSYLEEMLTLDANGKSPYYTFKYCLSDLEKVGLKYSEDVDVTAWNKRIIELLNSVKEKVLKNGYQSYVYDW